VSKFKAQEDYLPPEHSYKLLPFKFERLNDIEYVLTNLSGELTVIDDSELRRVVEYELKPTDPLFSTLRPNTSSMSPPIELHSNY
jgi:uncharacterized protein